MAVDRPDSLQGAQEKQAPVENHAYGLDGVPAELAQHVPDMAAAVETHATNDILEVDGFASEDLNPLRDRDIFPRLIKSNDYAGVQMYSKLLNGFNVYNDPTFNQRLVEGSLNADSLRTYGATMHSMHAEIAEFLATNPDDGAELYLDLRLPAPTDGGEPEKVRIKITKADALNMQDGIESELLHLQDPEIFDRRLSFDEKQSKIKEYFEGPNPYEGTEAIARVHRGLEDNQQVDEVVEVGPEQVRDAEPGVTVPRYTSEMGRMQLEPLEGEIPPDEVEPKYVSSGLPMLIIDAATRKGPFPLITGDEIVPLLNAIEGHVRFIELRYPGGDRSETINALDELMQRMRLVYKTGEPNENGFYKLD